MKPLEQYISDDEKFTGTKDEVDKYEKNIAEKARLAKEKQKRLNEIIELEEKLKELKRAYTKDYRECEYYGVDLDDTLKRMFGL